MHNKELQYSIYIGLNDSITGAQKFDTEKYISVLRNVCRNYGVAFTFHKINGGFFHKDGRYTEENTLMLTLIDVSKEKVIEIAEDLCTFFNQESVMITRAESSVLFVKKSV